MFTKLLFQIVFTVIIWEFLFRKFLHEHKVANEASNDSISIFTSLDLDRNNYLTLNEWLPFYNKIMKVGLQEIECNSSGERQVLLKTYFKPLRLENSMKDYVTENMHNPQIAKGLLKWQKAHVDEEYFDYKQFEIFLPPNKVEMGDVWWIVEPLPTDVKLSSFQYHPEHPQHLKCLQKIFSTFHPIAFLQTRFNPRGIAAVLQRSGDSLYHIRFRAHIEYQLEEPPSYPFWFTPAQFKGQLIINPITYEVYFFEMFLPNEKPLNVDMEWLYGPNETESMEVDLGYMPLMAINYSKLSYNFVSNYKWLNEIPEKLALDKLEQQMFPFKKIPYLNISEAFEMASIRNKLVHTIVLYGALDDQSC